MARVLESNYRASCQVMGKSQNEGPILSFGAVIYFNRKPKGAHHFENNLNVEAEIFDDIDFLTRGS